LGHGQPLFEQGDLGLPIARPALQCQANASSGNPAPASPSNTLVKSIAIATPADLIKPEG
jgi:hypothetical protein